MEYCNKYNLELEVITQPKYGIEPFDKFSNTANLFEKNAVYDLFDKYDRILRLDYDLLITPSCPNLFDIVPESKVGGVYEDIGIVEVSRKAEIQKIQTSLGAVDWNSGYMNVGVVVASWCHMELFNTGIDDIYQVQSIPDIRMPEQTYLNWMIRKLGFKVFELEYRFNHIMYFDPDRFDSYIIHYAGSKVYDADLMLRHNKVKDKRVWRELTALQMRRDWEVLLL